MNYNFIKAVNSEKLEKEILDTELSSLYSHILTSSSPLLATIVFTSNLTESNIVVLETLITNHTTSPSLTDIVKQSINNAMVFGQSLLLDFSTENVLMGITQEGKTGEVLSKLSTVLPAIQSGSLYEAISRIKSIPSSDYDSKYITEARLLIFINKIEVYLGIPLSTEL
jgi:hypothetical protein